MTGAPHSVVRWWIAGMVGVAAVGTAGWVALRRLRRRTAAELECIRRLRVADIGRLTSGEIIDLMPPPEPELPPTVVYQYDVGGVTYQVSQALHEVPVRYEPESWTPGLPVQVKFDAANPGNSIVVCERWSGLMTRRRKVETASASAPAPTRAD